MMLLRRVDLDVVVVEGDGVDRSLCGGPDRLILFNPPYL